MKHLILKKLLEGKNILLVGETNSGKSYFVKNQIIPLLKENNINVSYFEECADLEVDNKCDVCIVDEVELLFDKQFMEDTYPKEKPYYTWSYLQKVAIRQDKLSQIQKPVICIVTRNGKHEIDYVVKNYKKLEWNNLPVEVIAFEREKTNFWKKNNQENLI